MQQCACLNKCYLQGDQKSSHTAAVQQFLCCWESVLAVLHRVWEAAIMRCRSWLVLAPPFSLSILLFYFLFILFSLRDCL
jgi:hypothetical protein